MPAARILLATLAFSLTTIGHAAEPESYRAGSRIFADEMADRHGLDRAEVSRLLNRARYAQAVVDAMERPYERKPWADYRALFLTPQRIRDGAAYWRARADTLKRAESIYGVAPEIIVAIIGIETSYGRYLGRHSVLDALTTLGFSYPRRAEFFRSELASFLLLAREERIDPVGALGSYAGAMGRPQFIASSYRTFAVDFDGDGRRNLWGSDPDAIASVANYFRSHGWLPGQPVAFPAALRAGEPAGIETASQAPVAPAQTAAGLRSAGVSWRAELDGATPMTLIRFGGSPSEYWVGLDNFYAITRYNHSNLYALAVYQLSEAIRSRYHHARDF